MDENVTDGNRNTGCKKIAQMAEILNIYCKQMLRCTTRQLDKVSAKVIVI